MDKEILPECREKFRDLERDMIGVSGGEYGIRQKVGIMWNAYIKNKGSESLKKTAWGTILQIALGILQSGLLVYLITGGK